MCVIESSFVGRESNTTSHYAFQLKIRAAVNLPAQLISHSSSIRHKIGKRILLGIVHLSNLTWLNGHPPKDLSRKLSIFTHPLYLLAIPSLINSSCTFFHQKYFFSSYPKNILLSNLEFDFSV